MTLNETDVEAIHRRVISIDAHADIEIPGKESPYVGRDGRSRVAPDKMAAGGLDAAFMAVAAGPGPRTPQGSAAARRLADRKLAALRDLVADPTNETDLALTGGDVRTAKRDGRRAVVLTFQNAHIIGSEVAALRSFHEAGCRVFALTHIGHNDFADSSRPNFDPSTGHHEPREEHGGLSGLGRKAVDLVMDMGGVIDVTQLTEAGTLQVLERSTRPVIASHSNVRALCDVSRNLTEREIDGIAAGGGVVCVSPFLGYLFDSTDDAVVEGIRAARRAAELPEDYLYPFELYWELPDLDERTAFLRSVREVLGKATVDTMLDHLDHIVARVGVEHVGIGTDWNHGGGISGFQEATDAPNVTEALVRRGYDEAAIAAVWGENVLRVLDTTES